MAEDEMVGWHHQLNGHGFGWTPGLVMDRESWRAAVPGVAKSWTGLSDCTVLKLSFRPRLPCLCEIEHIYSNKYVCLCL